jgi:hypothetical protein
LLYINNLEKISVEIVKQTAIYIIDDFFANPNDIVDLLDKNEPRYHKWYQREITNFNNGTKFIDARHDIEGEPAQDLFTKLNILARQHIPKHGKIMSNIFQMLDQDFNDYKNNYWWPHFDYGYTGIIYLNDYNGVGTNLYLEIDKDVDEQTPEHLYPWRPKEKYEIVYEIYSRHNRLVLFDGKKLKHGMAVNDDTFFKEKRKNLVLFFEEILID